MSNVLGELNPVGYLEVWKKYADGTEELHFADNNMIVSGMGVGLALLFGGIGSNSILDYQIKYAQLGMDGVAEAVNVSSYTLVTELTELQYGTSSMRIESHDQIKNGVLVPEDMIVMPQEMIRRTAPNSVQYIITLDTNSTNEMTLNEIGLLMKNPTGYDGDPRPMLVAYRVFNEITKKEEFSLIFKWTLSF
jgi:hypothetical protein|tara:strand:- start:2023 stop:2598 length:576 start_codon:yes stop_codon:yes gene_type:complete